MNSMNIDKKNKDSGLFVLSIIFIFCALLLWGTTYYLSPPSFNKLNKISGKLSKIDYDRPSSRSRPRIIYVIESNNESIEVISLDPYPKQILAHSLYVGQVVDAWVYKEFILPTLRVGQIESSNTVYISYSDIANITKSDTELFITFSHISGALGFILLLVFLIKKSGNLTSGSS